MATIAELDEEGEAVSLDETLRRFWEEEFLQYIQEVFLYFNIKVIIICDINFS